MKNDETLEEKLERLSAALSAPRYDDGGYWRARCERIDVLGRLGRIEEGELEAEQMMNSVSRQDAWYGHVLRVTGTLAMLSGAPERARQTLERAVAWERTRPDSTGLALALSVYAMALSQRGELDAGRAAMDESVALHRASGDRPALADSLRRLAGIEYLEGRPRRSIVYAEEAARLLEEVGDEIGMAIALYQLGLVYSEVGANEQARDALQRALDIDGAHGDAMRATLEQTVLAVVEFESGNPDRAIHLLDSAQRAQESSGLRWYLALTLVNRGLVEHATGALDAAQRSFHRAAALGAETDNERIVTLARYHEAAIHALRGRHEHARSLTEGSVADRADRETVALLDAIIHIARHEATGDEADAERAVQLFHANASGDPHYHPVPAHWRIVSGLAETFLTTCGRSVGKPTLVASADALSFRVPGGPWVDLSRKRVLRTLFAALLHRRIDSPGSPFTAEELAAHAWPNAPFDEAALNRLYVSISKLRDLGLRDILLSDDGYLLDPGYAVQMT